MSTTLLYRGFGLRGYSYESTHYHEGGVFFWVRQERSSWRCAQCGRSELNSRGQERRSFRSLPIGRKSVSIVLAVPRVECRSCGAVRQVRIPFARERCTYTKSFERYALDLCHHMTVQDMARHLRVGWDMIKEMQKRDLTRRFARPKLKHLRHMAIDEIAVGRGRFLTVVLDLDSGRVVHVAPGKGGDALKSFWKRLRASHARVRAVAMDMSWAYAFAVQDHLPKAVIVFDHFHVVKLFNEKLSNLRRDLQREATDRLKKQVLKGTRWLLLKNPENLDPKRNEQQRLQDALSYRMRCPNHSKQTSYSLSSTTRSATSSASVEPSWTAPLGSNTSSPMNNVPRKAVSSWTSSDP